MKTVWIAIIILTVAEIAGGQTCRGIVGAATYYTAQSCRQEGTSGSWTASGKRFDESALTCALPKEMAKAMNIQFGDSVRVTNLDSGKKIVVRYTDTGPGKKAQKRGVVIDLSIRAMIDLAGGSGVHAGRVKVEIGRVK